MRKRTELVDDSPEIPVDEDWVVEVHGTPSRFPGLIRFAAGLGATVVVLVLLAFAIPPILPEAWTRSTAERVLGEALGLPVKITGSHSFSLLPNVGLSATGIVAGSGASNATAMEIGALDVDMSTLGLMSASADIHRLAVTRPSFTVTLAHGGASAEAADEIDRSWGWWRNLTVEDLNVSDGRITVLGRDGRTAYRIEGLSLVRVAPRGAEPQDGLAFVGKAAVNGKEIDARISTSDPALFVQGNRWPIRVDVKSELLNGTFNGALAMRQDLVGDGRIELSSADAAGLNAWIGPLLPARAGSDMKVTAQLTVDGDEVSVTGASIKVGETSARGAFRLLDVSSGHSRADGTFDAETLDLSGDGWLPMLIAGDRTLGTIMLPPGSIEVTWQRILWGTHEFGLGRGTVERGEGGSRVTLNLEEMDTYGGTLRGKITLDASEGMRALDAEATLVNVELGPLAATTSVSLATPVTGQSTISVKLFSVGADAQQLMEALAGEADVIVSDGVLTLPALTAGVMDTQRKGIPFKTLTGNFQIAQGIGHSDDLLLRATDISLVGKGTVDLTDGKVDLDVGRLGGKEGEQRSLKRFRVSGPTDAITVTAINGS